LCQFGFRICHGILGGSVVVDLTNDASFHDSNVVDLTRETLSDSSVDSNPVIVVLYDFLKHTVLWQFFVYSIFVRNRWSKCQ